MKTPSVSPKSLRKSSITSFSVEGLKPSSEAIILSSKLLDGKISKDIAIAKLCDKYKVNADVR